MKYTSIVKGSCKKSIGYLYRGLAVGSVVLAFTYGGIYLGLKQQRAQEFLQEKLNQYLPFQVHFDELRFQWRGINPGFLMEKVSIYADGSDKPNLVIEEVFGYVNLPALIFFKKRIIEELTLVGTDIVLETQDYLQYQIKAIPQLSFSLESKYSKQWMDRFRFIDSDVIIEHPKYTYNFTQTDILISPNKPLPVIGHATYIDSEGKPCFINFKHFKNSGNNQHQWMLSYFGSLEHIDNLFVSHDWVMNDNLVTEGNAYAVAWITQHEEAIDLYVHANIQSFHAHYDDITVAADVFDGTFIGKKTKDEWWFAIKDFNTQKGTLNTVDMAVLSNLQLSLKKKIKDEGHVWEFNTAHLPVTVLNEIKKLASSVQLDITKYPIINTPKGHIDYLAAEIYSSATQTTLQSLKVDFENVSLNIPNQFEIQNLTGQINFDNQQAKININSQGLSFLKSEWFLEPFGFDTVKGTLFLDNFDQHLTVAGYNFNFGVNQSSMASSFQLVVPKELEKNIQPSPELDLVAHLENVPVIDVKKYLPARKLKPELYDWLMNALDKGKLIQGTLVCRGLVNEFPFKSSQGVFQAYAQIEDVNLNFAPGWPLLTEANVDLVFDHRALSIKGQGAKIQDVPIQEINVTIPDLTNQLPLLLVDLESSSTLDKATQVMMNSPLKEKVGKPLQLFGLRGDMNLALSLSIPLRHDAFDDIKVKGKVDTSDAQINLAKRDILVEKANGQILFTKDSISIEKLLGVVWEQPTEFSMNALLTEEGSTKIDVKGVADVHRFIPVEQPLLRQVIHGMTDYTAHFNLKGFGSEPHGEFVVHSDLVGVELNFPAPFYKDNTQEKKLKITGVMPSDQVNQYYFETDDYHMVLGFDAHHTKIPKFLGGHLCLGKQSLATFKSDGKFLVNGQVAHIEAKKIIDWYQTNKQTASTPMSIEPKIDLRLEALNLYGFPLQTAHIEGKYDKKLENILFSIQSDNLSGFISIPTQSTHRVIVVDLDTVIITDDFKKQSVQTEDILPVKSHQGMFKNPLELKIKNLIYRDKKINYIHAQFEPVSYGYYIKNFDFNLGDAQIDASGYWHTSSNKSRMDLTGKIKTKDVASVTEALALKGSINKAKGEADFSLSWDGYPFYIIPSSVSGEMNFKLRDGVIQGVNPGFGRILSLLNIDNFRRRLNLDFSDLTKGGITFDSLTGTMHLLDGVLHSDKVIMDSVSVKVETTFMSNLETQVLHGHVDVMPNLTGSLPIAAAIAAGNPAIGAAVWVMDKLFGKQIQEINRYQYRLMGTWNNPLIEDMNLKRHARRDFGRN